MERLFCRQSGTKTKKYEEVVSMNAFATAVLVGAALLALAVWVEVRERRAAPGDGNYRSSGPRS